MISASCACRSSLGKRSGSSGSAAAPLSSIMVSRSWSALTGFSPPPSRERACLRRPYASPSENPPPPPPVPPAARRARPSSGRRRGPRDRSSRGASVRSPVGCAAAPGTPGPSPISYCPLSSLVRLMSPLCAASTTNFEKRENPRSFSLKVGSISCITCLSRSERMTSLCAVICFTASITSSHGSWRTWVTSDSLVSPASSL